MKPARSDRKGERAAAARARGNSSNNGHDSSSPGIPGGPLQLQRESSDGTVARIARILRRRCPQLGEGPADDASAVYIAASLVGYASEKQPQSTNQWCALLEEVLSDAGMHLDENQAENMSAIRWVVDELIKTGVLAVASPQVEKGAIVLALLSEDDDWHEAIVDEIIDQGACFRVVFLEYGKPQETTAANVRTLDAVVDDEGTEERTQEGDCEMCGRHMLLTFHHLIPKDTHPTYLKKRLPSGIEGEPSRSFLNTYGTMVCRACHSYIHSLASNEVLAKEYNTLEKILAHAKVQRWVEWAGKHRAGNWAM